MKDILRRTSITAAAGAAATFLVIACGSSRSGFEEPPPTSSLGGDASTPPPDVFTPCVSDTLKAEPVGLSMLIVIDRSGSMAGAKWDMARNAMISFADSPDAVGAKLGLSVFPPDNSSACDVPSFAPIVPIAPLPGNALPIKDALVSRSTTGSTPMTPAMQAGVLAMKAHLAKTPNEAGVVILVTDGEPGGCSSTLSTVISEASNAKNGTPSIRTFVVGMEGATFANLDQIAIAGGSTTSYNASGGGDGGVSSQQQLLDALDSIRSGALGCEYVLPTPPADKGVLDPATVEIQFTAGLNDPMVTFKHVTDSSKCGATTGGFYYDDPAHPSRIILCPASCEDVQGASAQAKVNVFLGCIKKVT